MQYIFVNVKENRLKVSYRSDFKLIIYYSASFTLHDIFSYTSNISVSNALLSPEDY